MRTAESEIFLRYHTVLEHELDDLSHARVLLERVVNEQRLSNGSGAQQADRVWEKENISLAQDAITDFRLSTFSIHDIGSGDGRDALGQLLTIEEIVCLVIHKTGGSGVLEIQATLPANHITWIPVGYATVENGGALKTNCTRMWYEDDDPALDVELNTADRIRFGAKQGSVIFSVHVLGRQDDEVSSSSTST